MTTLVLFKRLQKAATTLDAYAWQQARKRPQLPKPVKFEAPKPLPAQPAQPAQAVPTAPAGIDDALMRLLFDLAVFLQQRGTPIPGFGSDAVLALQHGDLPQWRRAALAKSIAEAAEQCDTLHDSQHALLKAALAATEPDLRKAAAGVPAVPTSLKVPGVSKPKKPKPVKIAFHPDRVARAFMKLAQQPPSGTVSTSAPKMTPGSPAGPGGTAPASPAPSSGPVAPKLAVPLVDRLATHQFAGRPVGDFHSGDALLASQGAMPQERFDQLSRLLAGLEESASAL
jgi:hypothetical protein